MNACHLLFACTLLAVANSPVRPSDKIEADTMNIIRCSSGETIHQKLAEDGYANEGDFTDGTVLSWINAEDKGAVLELSLPAEKKGKYDIKMHLGKYRCYGIFQVLMNGKAAGKTIDFYGSPGQDIVLPFNVTLSGVNLNDGDNTLAFKLTGSNPETIMANNGLAIDWVELTYKGTSGGDGEVEDPGTVTPPTTINPPTPAGVIEADTLKVLKKTSGDTVKANHAEDGYADEGSFSKNKTLLWNDANGPGAVLELALPVKAAGLYKITLHLGKYRTFGIHQFQINGKAAGKKVDLFGSPGQDIILPFNVTLGSFVLKAGTNRLGLKVVGTNPDTIMANYGACLDWIKLTKVGATKSK